MSKPIAYIVSLAPAEKTAFGFTACISTMLEGTKHTVTASTLPDLERQVRTLAAAFGQSCSPYVRLADRKARKPAGFEAWTNRREIQFIEFVGPQYGERAACAKCGQDIEWLGDAWRDRGSGSTCGPDYVTLHVPYVAEGEA